MSWQDDFRSHNVWAHARRVHENINGAINAGALDASDDDVDLLRDLVVRVLAQRDDPNVAITRRSLDVVASALDKIHAAFPDVRMIARYHDAPFEQIATEVRTWPQSGKGRLTGLGNLVSDLASYTNRTVRELNASFEEIRETISRSETDFRSVVSDQIEQSERSVAVANARLDELRNELRGISDIAQKQASRIDAAIREHQAVFTASEHERNEQNVTESTRRTSEWEMFLDSSRDEIATHMEVMRGREAQSQRVLAAIGINSTATHYGSYASDQGRIAGRWRIYASLILAAAGIWFVASSIFPQLHGDGALWEQAVSRLGITAAVAGVGLYAARESSQHREQERRARHVELILTALEPFVANLDPTRAEQIRDDAARKIFVSDYPSPGKETVPTGYTDLLRELLEDKPAKASKAE